MRILEYDACDPEELAALCERNPTLEPHLQLCKEVFDEVGRRGDEALREYTRRWDGVEVDSLICADLDDRRARLPEATIQALQRAAANIETFHLSQLRAEPEVEVEVGVRCWRLSRPIRSVGLYVPGGSAVLPSSVLMLAIPARLAGCREISLCVPPDASGGVADAVMEAARLAGVTRIHAVGGAQAIAAMALGTESVPAVDKILGPGSQIVQAAKLMATFHGVAIDMVAGPSEVLVIADQEADADLVAADLLAQAEHGSDSVAVLATDNAALAARVCERVGQQLETLPRRQVAADALQRSFAVVTSTIDQAMEFSNRFAPEHLVLQVVDPAALARKVESAGSVFLGSWSPEVAGDYASGTNHTLPTGGWARSTSGVSVDSMVKKVTFQELTAQGLQKLAPTLQEMARLEGLEGHRQAVVRRLQRLAGVRS